MMVDIFGKIEYVYELTNSVSIKGDRLYIFLSFKQSTPDGKPIYECLGSMLSTLEDKNTSFISAFLDIATHYAVPVGPQSELIQNKEQLDKNDWGLVFEGKASV